MNELETTTDKRLFVKRKDVNETARVNKKMPLFSPYQSSECYTSYPSAEQRQPT